LERDQDTQLRGGLAFQSLIGILMNWNCVEAGCFLREIKFQSLIGILMNWNARDKPKRLQCLHQVSIPNRDFDELEPYLESLEERYGAFQSLIGILMNWNVALLLPPQKSFLKFQSLIGILMNWNMIEFGIERILSRFQSLIGILMNWNN